MDSSLREKESLALTLESTTV